MRSTTLALALSALAAAPLSAQEHEASPGLLSPNTGLMFWTLLIFFALFFILKRYAFPVIIGAVEAREQALEEAIQSAKRDREEAARLLAEHRANLDASRGEGQRIIAEARAAAERVRADLVEQAHTEQASMMARTRREIETERAQAQQQMRREAVDLAIAGASRVIDKNLDAASNRQLVERFLASVTPGAVKASR